MTNARVLEHLRVSTATSGSSMPRESKQPAKPPPDTRPVNQRGVLYQAEKLTGARAQNGETFLAVAVLLGVDVRGEVEGHAPKYVRARGLPDRVGSRDAKGGRGV